ncbi:MAG: DUF2807 domain-containing protein [bacterium]|nr:DUF2807 domain-containing protein [bacterium]
MKATYFLGAVMSLAFVFTSCKKAVKPSDDITTESRQLTGYSKLDVSDAMEVEVTFGQQEEVVVEANSNLHQYILTDVVNGVLKIRMKNNVRIKSGAEIKVYVSATTIDQLIIDGASRVEFMNDVTTTNFEVDIDGASRFQGGVYTGDLKVDAEGASNVEMWGTADSAEIEASGASNIGDFAFLINNYLNIDLSGSSKAELTVDGVMDIEVSGASRFNYKGNGVINELDISGASSVNKQ